MTHDTNQLAELLQQKHTLLTQIHALATRQLELTESGNPSMMISLLAAKQGLIDGLMRVEKSLAPFRSQSPEQRVWNSATERAQAAAISSECNELLRQVMELDRLGIDRAQQRQQHTKMQIDVAHQAASARNAYLSTDGVPPNTIDVASEA